MVVLLKEGRNICQLNLLAESLVCLLSLQGQMWPLGGVGADFPQTGGLQEDSLRLRASGGQTSF